MYESPFHCLTAHAYHSRPPWEYCGIMCVNATLVARDLWVVSCKCPGLFGSTVVPVCVRWIRRYLSRCRSRCAVQVVKPRFGEPLFASLLRAGTEESNCKSWVQVAKCGTTSGKGKSVHTKQLYNGAQAVYSLDDYAKRRKSVYMKQCACGLQQCPMR